MFQLRLAELNLLFFILLPEPQKPFFTGKSFFLNGYNILTNYTIKKHTGQRSENSFGQCVFDRVLKGLEQPCYLAGVSFDINAAKGRIGAGARHQADRAGAGTEEFSA